MINVTQRDAILAALIGAAAPYDPAGCWLGLFKSIVDKGVNTLLTDLTMPATSLAVRQPITTYGTAYVLSNGCAVIDGPLMNFRPASGADADTVLGWYLADALAAGNLLQFGYLSQGAVHLADNTQSVSAVFRLTVDPSGQWDASVTFNG